MYSAPKEYLLFLKFIYLETVSPVAQTGLESTKLMMILNFFQPPHLPYMFVGLIVRAACMLGRHSTN